MQGIPRHTQPLARWESNALFWWWAVCRAAFNFLRNVSPSPWYSNLGWLDNLPILCPLLRTHSTHVCVCTITLRTSCGYNLPKKEEMSSAVTSEAFIYGTSWKGNATALRVTNALEAGFCALDTAAQPKHNREELVGEGVREFLRKHNKHREDIYVPTQASPFSLECQFNSAFRFRRNFPQLEAKTWRDFPLTQMPVLTNRSVNQFNLHCTTFDPPRILALSVLLILIAFSYTPRSTARGRRLRRGRLWNHMSPIKFVPLEFAIPTCQS
jgi:hypothetical protein